MRLNESFARPLRQPPGGASTLNHRLLVQAGYVDQLMAGVYTYLPLGLIVLNKISQIVREEMNSLGGEEMLMPLLHPADIWKKSGGWDGVDVLFKVPSRTDKQADDPSYALAQSEEEVIAPLFLDRVISTQWMDRARMPYHIHWKFRDELRAKSGILRGREFLMKDMYSFHATQEDFDQNYENIKQGYLKTFERLGLTAKVTEASGGNFTDKVSYEFEVLTDAGEDTIYYCEACDYCVEDEIAKVKPGDNCPKCGKGKLKQAKAAEVGNVFDLGQKYPKAFGMQITTDKNERIYPIMGCYGIGVSRVMGVIVEKHADQNGIIWPEAVAPFPVHLVRLGDNPEVTKAADELYQALGQNALYDDRDESAGVKFNDADLLGIPRRVTISQSSVKQGSIELKLRASEQKELIPLKDAVKALS